MSNPREIRIDEFDYELPEHLIAHEPCEVRDQSNLLVYDQGDISHRKFLDITELLDSSDSLVWNNARVINARLHFQKPTGGAVEIFVLEPYESTPEKSMAHVGSTTWKCMIGGAKKWKSGPIQLVNPSAELESLQAFLVTRDPHFIVQFKWDTQLSWGDILEKAGQLPLPPYMNRNAREEDRTNYQTVYAKNEGSVAAPTAGLHFTERVIDALKSKGVNQHEVTLHVGAGTFKPVSSDTVGEHDMHAELVMFEKAELEALQGAKQVVSVGTTTMRSLESLYWFAVHLKAGATGSPKVSQWAPYELEATLTRNEVFEQILTYMSDNDMPQLYLSTSIIIAPGYTPKMIDGLITNFHLPKSTLLLLISACVGDDWRKIYEEALAKEYRFLSYGDSSFLKF